MAARNEGGPDGERIIFRIGVNLGDVIVEGTDLHGDGVNVAARLESMAEPGGICISAKFHAEVQGKVGASFIDMGERMLKNIALPQRVYKTTAEASVPKPALALPDKPSIAVLPFANRSGDPEQDYFADGVVEDIITALSRKHGLFRHRPQLQFQLQGPRGGHPTDWPRAGGAVCAGGQCPQIGHRLRITAQLVEAATGAQLWADHHDGSLDDVFEFQDRITAAIVTFVAPQIEAVEVARALRLRPDSLDAHDVYLRYGEKTRSARIQDYDEALVALRPALERFPDDPRRWCGQRMRWSTGLSWVGRRWGPMTGRWASISPVGGCGMTQATRM